MTVSVICEECGKLYHVPIAKLDKVKSDVVKTKCKKCGYLILIKKEGKAYQKTQVRDSLEETAEEEFNPDEFDEEDFDNLEKAFQESAQETAAAPVETAAPKKRGSGKKGKSGMGLRVKMLFLFLVIPLLLMSVSGFLTLKQMNVLTDDITAASADILKQMGEASIEATGKAVAAQCKLYLDSHPNLKREDFVSDMVLRKLAIQKVGKTGYTVLSSVGPFTSWLHPNPKLHGVQLTKVIKKLLGSEYPRFLKIIAAAEKGKNVKSRGYYLWKDTDGKMREKFMTLSPIVGTDYNIAATTYIHEFTAPLQKLETQAEAVAAASLNLNLIILVGTLVVIGLIVTLYGHNLTSRIRQLTEVADRISVGELDAEITIKAKDEIGSLAEAITRMQDSLRLSIERLRKKR
jgi:HAMP domain-containing protein